MKIEYWNTEWVSSRTASGMSVCKNKSMLKEVQEWKGTDEEVFKKFYHENNSLKYCNGTHYSFVNAEDRAKYNVFVKEYNTIENYYNGGIVD